MAQFSAAFYLQKTGDKAVAEELQVWKPPEGGPAPGWAIAAGQATARFDHIAQNRVAGRGGGDAAGGGGAWSSPTSSPGGPKGGGKGKKGKK